MSTIIDVNWHKIFTLKVESFLTAELLSNTADNYILKVYEDRDISFEKITIVVVGASGPIKVGSEFGFVESVKINL